MSIRAVSGKKFLRERTFITAIKYLTSSLCNRYVLSFLRIVDSVENGAFIRLNSKFCVLCFWIIFTIHGTPCGFCWVIIMKNKYEMKTLFVKIFHGSGAFSCCFFFIETFYTSIERLQYVLYINNRKKITEYTIFVYFLRYSSLIRCWFKDSLILFSYVGIVGVFKNSIKHSERYFEAI